MELVGWLDEWMDRQVGGWVDGQAGRWTDRCVDVCMYGWKDELMERLFMSYFSLM
jgi:hypothetical protein